MGSDKQGLLETLFKSRKQGVDLLEALNDGILLFDKDRRIQFANAVARRVLGYGEGEILHERCRDVVQGSHCATKCPLRQLIETGVEERNVHMTYTSKDGRVLEVTTSFYVIKDGGEGDLGYAEIFKDVTELSALKRGVGEATGFDSIVGQNSRMREIYQLITEVAPTDATVLITGESGTGKELIARAIHNYSNRKAHAFVKVNCAALAEGVLESELFGHVRGAFTGAFVERKGRFELANKGTIFLDEIGDLGASVQVKLLRVLQEGEYEMVGQTETRHTDVRVVAATNQSLQDLIKKGEFREDLYYRLKVVPINLPALRDRKDDIPLLVQHFIKKNNIRMKRTIEKASREFMNLLMMQPLPGNIRELENILEHAFVRCHGDVLEVSHLPTDFFQGLEAVGSKPSSGVDPLRQAERDAILSVLERCCWNLQTAMKVLKVSRATLWRKMKDYGIQRPEKNTSPAQD